jgi:hypothetical protein
MTERFDQLSRTLGRSTSRRGVLKLFFGAAAASTAATVLRPFRAQAATCPGGQAPCGPGCCAGTCTDRQHGCCCPAGSTPCGSNCCKAGVACLNAATGACGCPAGTTRCTRDGVVACCPQGKACPACLTGGGPTGPACSHGCTCYTDFDTGAFFCSTGVQSGSFCNSDADCPSGYLCPFEVSPCVQVCPGTSPSAGCQPPTDLDTASKACCASCTCTTGGGINGPTCGGSSCTSCTCHEHYENATRTGTFFCTTNVAPPNCTSDACMNCKSSSDCPPGSVCALEQRHCVQACPGCTS